MDVSPPSVAALQDWLDTVLPQGQVRDQPSGTILFAQGETVASLGILLTGQVTASLVTEDGQQVWLADLASGEFVGASDLLNGQPSQFDLVAATRVSLLYLPAGFVRARIDAGDPVARYLAQALAAQYARLAQRFVEAQTLSAKGRVIAELLRLAVPSGGDTARLIVRPHPVFVDLAVRINSTRETVSRVVNELQKQGIISRRTGALEIEKPAALKASKP